MLNVDSFKRMGFCEKHSIKMLMTSDISAKALQDTHIEAEKCQDCLKSGQFEYAKGMI